MEMKFKKTFDDAASILIRIQPEFGTHTPY